MSKASLTATARRAIAEARYHEAINDPTAANWRDVAELLFSCLPKQRAKVTDSFWADYDFGKKAQRTVIEVSFSDGRIVRANVNSDPGKAYNIGRGIRVAIAFYRTRIFRLIGWPHLSAVSFGPDGRELPAWDSCIDVPAIDRVTRTDTGESFDVQEVNERTADLRSGSWSLYSAMMEAARLNLAIEGADGFPWFMDGYWQHVQDSYRNAWETAAGLETRAEVRARAIAAHEALCKPEPEQLEDPAEWHPEADHTGNVQEDEDDMSPEVEAAWSGIIGSALPPVRSLSLSPYRPSPRLMASVALPRFAVA